MALSTNARGDARALRAALARVVGEDAVLQARPEHLRDATESRGICGAADAYVVPNRVEGVAAVMHWCYEHGVPLTPRGGGTGFAGGAVPTAGGIVVGLERLRAVRSFDPLLWRIEVEAGFTTGELQRRARENGLLYPPDPGAAEQSQIGGNIATNAGGPHAFKYGVTGTWTMGIEVVLPPGDVVQIGGALRKDVAGYDLKSLLIGSEGTLGVVTAAWMRLLPAPDAAYPVVGFLPNTSAACQALETIIGSGIGAAALEFLDAATMSLCAGAYPGSTPPVGSVAIISEADGVEASARAARAELVDALTELGATVDAPTIVREIRALWRWRDGAAMAVAASRGGKISEDIVVPVDQLAAVLAGIDEIAAGHGLQTCTWGHAGDGNLHATFLIDPQAREEIAAAERAAHELFELAIALGGSISGEHGLGMVKNGQLGRQWSPRAVDLHRSIKDLFDPRGLMNPGKKVP